MERLFFKYFSHLDKNCYSESWVQQIYINVRLGLRVEIARRLKQRRESNFHCIYCNLIGTKLKCRTFCLNFVNPLAGTLKWKSVDMLLTPSIPNEKIANGTHYWHILVHEYNTKSLFGYQGNNYERIFNWTNLQHKGRVTEVPVYMCQLPSRKQSQAISSNIWFPIQQGSVSCYDGYTALTEM